MNVKRAAFVSIAVAVAIAVAFFVWPRLSVLWLWLRSGSDFSRDLCFSVSRHVNISLLDLLSPGVALVYNYTDYYGSKTCGYGWVYTVYLGNRSSVVVFSVDKNVFFTAFGVKKHTLYLSTICVYNSSPKGFPASCYLGIGNVEKINNTLYEFVSPANPANLLRSCEPGVPYPYLDRVVREGKVVGNNFTAELIDEVSVAGRKMYIVKTSIRFGSGEWVEKTSYCCIDASTGIAIAKVEDAVSRYGRTRRVYVLSGVVDAKRIPYDIKTEIICCWGYWSCPGTCIRVDESTGRRIHIDYSQLVEK